MSLEILLSVIDLGRPSVLALTDLALAFTVGLLEGLRKRSP